MIRQTEFKPKFNIILALKAKTKLQRNPNESLNGARNESKREGNVDKVKKKKAKVCTLYTHEK